MSLCPPDSSQPKLGYTKIRTHRGETSPCGYNLGKEFSGVPLSQTKHYPFKEEGVIALSDVIKWPHPEIPSILSKLDKVERLEDFRIPDILDNSLRRHLIRFKETLLWWSSTTKDAIGTPKGIFYSACERGPQFADELDDSIKYSLRESSNCTLLYGGLEWPSSVKNIRNVDQFFSPYHLPPFQREETDDITLLFSERPKIEKTLIERFKGKVREFIHDPIGDKRELDDLDRLKFLTSSSTFLPDKNVRVAKSVQRAANATLKTTETFIFDYVNVFKAPHESRACVVPSPETLNSLVLLEAQLGQVITSPSDVFRQKDFSWLPKWLSFYGHYVFIMSDQRKCGLTFPLELVLTLYEELETRFPSWDFNLAKGYSSAFVKYNGKMTPITNGVGLGMLNATISIVTSILFEIWKEDQDPDFHLEGLFYNDDQVIRAAYHDVRRNPLHQELVDMALSWDVFMESFGLQVHKKKPFIAASGIFLETYGEGFPVVTTKRCQRFGNLFKPLCAGSITQAKEWFSSAIDALEPHERQEGILFLKPLLAYWGYELHPEEHCLPLQLGGWVREVTEEGLDSLFISISNLPLRFERMVNVLQVKKNSYKKLPAKWNNFKSRLAKVEKDLKLDVIPIQGLWADYCTMALSAIGRTRFSQSGWVRAEISYQTHRQEALKSRPLPSAKIQELYWNLVLEEGKAYAPPPSIAQVKENYSFRGTSVEIGTKKTNRPSNLLRDYFNLWKTHGYLKHYSFWSPTPVLDSNELLYWICREVIENNLRATPRNILFGLILGWSEWEKLYLFTQRVYGRYVFPVPEAVRDVSDVLFGVGQIDNSYLIDHNLQLIFPLPVEDIDGFETFRAQRVALNVLNQYIQRVPDSVLPIKPEFETWEDLTKELARFPVDHPGKDPPDDNMVTSQEDLENDRLLLRALIAQIEDVARFTSVEVGLRADLASQIYGNSDVPGNLFEESDEPLDLDMWG